MKILTWESIKFQHVLDFSRHWSINKEMTNQENVSFIYNLLNFDTTFSDYPNTFPKWYFNFLTDYTYVKMSWKYSVFLRNTVPSVSMSCSFGPIQLNLGFSNCKFKIWTKWRAFTDCWHQSEISGHNFANFIFFSQKCWCYTCIITNDLIILNVENGLPSMTTRG